MFRGPLRRTLETRRCIYNDAIQQFIQQNQLISQSSVFQGSLYEHTVIRELGEKLGMTKLQKVGGANDRGVDIKAYWPIEKIYDRMNALMNLEQIVLPKRCKVNGATFKPFRDKIHTEKLKVLVQCKAFTSSKVAPKEFRELVGTFSSLVSSSQRNKTVIMMCSPNMLTKDGLNLINSIRMPLVFLRIEMLQLKDGIYDVANSGKLVNYYENEYASMFLQGCGIKEWLKLAMFDAK